MKPARDGRYSPALLLLGLLGFSNPAEAGRTYVALEYDFQSIKISGERYSPQGGLLTLGYWLSTGIGLELSGGATIDSDHKAGLTLESDNLRSLALRFESPNTNGVTTFITLGAVELELNGSTTGGANFPGEGDFDGYLVGIGINSYFAQWPRTALSLSASKLGIDDDISAYSMRIGLRHDF